MQHSCCVGMNKVEGPNRLSDRVRGIAVVVQAQGGASSVTAVDSSEPALALARRNCDINGVSGSVSFEQGDVLDFLIRASKEGLKYDIVILDPPKLAPSRKDLDRCGPLFHNAARSMSSSPGNPQSS